LKGEKITFNLKEIKGYGTLLAATKYEGKVYKTTIKKVISIVDRKEAIRTACMMAQKGDVILVAGKGHETYQEIKGVKHHFDDKEVLQDIFKEQ